MKLTDLNDTGRFQHVGDSRLTEWVLHGEHYPEVRVYFEHTSGITYQVCAKAGLYRCTPKADPLQVLRYGEWQAIE